MYWYMANREEDLKKITMRLLLVLLMTQLSHVDGYQLADVQRLLRDKTANYTKIFRPIHNQRKALDVRTAFDLVSIQEFDERQEKVTVTGILFTGWKDELFTWDPKDYNGVWYLLIDTSQIWIPPMTLINSVDDVDKVSEDWHSLYVTADGYVQYNAGGIFSFSCLVDVTYYPWDRQACQLWFYPWGYSTQQLNMIHLNEKIRLSFFFDNGVWNLVGSRTGLVNKSVTVFFELHLERKPRFVLINVLSPIVFMSFLNVLIFLIPPDSGERISYSITVLLAIAVFLTLVGDNLPKTSSPISILSYYLLTVLVTSVCITLATITGLRIFHCDDPEVGKFWKYLTLCTGCRYRKFSKNGRRRKYMKREADNGYMDGGIRNGCATISSSTGNNTDIRIASGRIWSITDPAVIFAENRSGRIMYNSESDKARQGFYEEDDDDHVSWKDVSSALDRIFFVIFLIILVTLTLSFLIYVAGSARK